ncbi:unnamed protein product [Pleuronectes platessa]|uniref:Uncharacterized protein n=1 Tax=Pleuronectes platessa TaxID=8262 RepID=A0A9N7YK88_PLEPL|nr:unnamed protein product [Pleuronectes platessa]
MTLAEAAEENRARLEEAFVRLRSSTHLLVLLLSLWHSLTPDQTAILEATLLPLLQDSPQLERGGGGGGGKCICVVSEETSHLVAAKQNTSPPPPPPPPPPPSSFLFVFIILFLHPSLSVFHPSSSYLLPHPFALSFSSSSSSSFSKFSPT